MTDMVLVDRTLVLLDTSIIRYGLPDRRTVRSARDVGMTRDKRSSSMSIAHCSSAAASSLSEANIKKSRNSRISKKAKNANWYLVIVQHLLVHY